MTRAEMITAFFLFLGILVVVYLQIFTKGLPIDKAIDATYINGALTAAGILIAFLTASAISGRKYLRQFHYLLIEGCFGAFLLAVVSITASEVQGTPILGDYLLLQFTLVFSGITALVIVRRVSRVVLEEKRNE
ncbi:MAG: hypothetical protein ACE14S_11785 [Candidatus Bathyarchaeia archaeon]